MGHARGREDPHHWWPAGDDGSLHLGVGPGAFAVAGGLPADPRGTLGWGVVERLSAAPARLRRDVTPDDVRGPGQLAGPVRASLRGVAPGSRRPRAPDDGARAGSAGPGAVDRPSGSRPVVTVHDHVVPLGSVRHPALAGRPVLPVVAQTARVVIGPWTGLPGGPCLHCLDLHRRDRDPHWPATAASLEDPLTAPLPPVLPDEVVRAVVALTVLLGARVPRVATGAAHEVGPWPPHLVTRRWPRHTGCPWHPAAAAG